MYYSLKVVCEQVDCRLHIRTRVFDVLPPLRHCAIHQLWHIMCHGRIVYNHTHVL